MNMIDNTQQREPYLRVDVFLQCCSFCVLKMASPWSCFAAHLTANSCSCSLQSAKQLQCLSAFYVPHPSITFIPACQSTVDTKLLAITLQTVQSYISAECCVIMLACKWQRATVNAGCILLFLCECVDRKMFPKCAIIMLHLSDYMLYYNLTKLTTHEVQMVILASLYKLLVLQLLGPNTLAPQASIQSQIYNTCSAKTPVSPAL